MAKKDVFICDYCHKQSPPITEGSNFPYVQGWRSLTNMEFKLSSEYRHELILKHFCSNKCTLAFIERFIYEQEDELQLSLSQKQNQHQQPEKKHVSMLEPIKAIFN